VGRLIQRSGVIRGRVGPKRKTDWIASAISPGMTALASGAAVIQQSFASGGEPFTVVRTRGLFVAKSDQVAASEEPNGAFGMEIVSSPALAAGVASVPTPLTEQPSELWFVWEAYQAVVDVAAGAGQVLSVVRFDSKAQRKVQSGEQIIVVIENSASGFGIVFSMSFRMLLMLH